MPTARSAALLSIATAVALFLPCPVALAQGPDEADPVLVELREKVDLFFRNLVNTDVTPEAAFGELLAGGRLARPENAAAVKALAAQTKEFDKKFGEYVGHESVAAKRVGKDLVLMRHLYKSQDYPVVWYFAFYRTTELDTWVVISVRFDTRIDLLGL